MSHKLKANLFYADSERNADVLYLGNFFTPDPFLVIQLLKDAQSQILAVVNPLEYDRCRAESRFNEVLLWDDWEGRAKRHFQAQKVGVAEIVSCIQKAYRIEKFYVNDSFPIGFADQLRKLRVPFEIRVGRIAERAVKSEAEVEALREASRVAALGMRFAEDAFRKAIVKNGILFLDNAPLTSERVITGIEMTCLEHGGLASHTIVAGGIQASQPHCTGFGPLPANAFIVVDIFPRIKKTGYFGDLSRTFFKGKPSEEQRKLIETVQKAQKMAIESLKPGRDGREIYYKVCDFFASEGYVTDLTGTSQRTDITNLVDSSLQPAGKKGFIHSLGHGVGLEIHEAPSLGKRASAILKPNMVFTIEPGLYYPKQHLGGVRIEDVICLRESGPEMLSNYPYEWEV